MRALIRRSVALVFGLMALGLAMLPLAAGAQTDGVRPPPPYSGPPPAPQQPQSQQPQPPAAPTPPTVTPMPATQPPMPLPQTPK